MKVALITPTRLETDVRLGFQGDYAMILAHLVDKGAYDCMKGKVPTNCYVIMDNSAYELGTACDIENIVRIAQKFDVDEIVLPDVLNDGKATQRKVLDAIDWLKKHDMCSRWNLMAVCQGKDPDDFAQTFDYLISLPQVHAIGIPKMAARFFKHGRAALEPLWLSSNNKKVIHLLGCPSSLRELDSFQYPARIRSIDTCIPALFSSIENPPDRVYANRPEDRTIDLEHDFMDQTRFCEYQLQLRRDKWI